MRLVLVGCCVSAASGGARATEDARLVMSHRCVVDHGKLLLLTSEDRSYQILGPREHQLVSLCRSGRDCRDIAAYKFDVACEGGTMPWVEIAAALSNQRLGPAIVESGRLRIWPRSSRAGDKTSADKVSASPVTFPAGYAPLEDVGSRVVVVADFVAAAAPTEDEQIADPFGPTAERTDLTTLPTTIATATAAPLAPWSTTVTPATRIDAAMAAIPSWLSSWSLAAIALTGSVLFLLGRGRALAPGHWRPRSRHMRGAAGLSPEARACGDIIDIADRLLGTVAERAAGLQGAAQLRRIIARECERLRRRLDTARDQRPNSPDGWRRQRTRLEAIVAELIRLKDIAESAAGSLGKPHAPVVVYDRQSAYEALGASPDVSERALKKLVDALRACWHPDHATDDEDRRRREARIKEINIAWDMITGKRKEA